MTSAGPNFRISFQHIPERAEIENLFEELRLASAAVTEMFTRHMLEDERERELAASVGAADEEVEQYFSALDRSSFAGQVAASEESTSVWDAATTELEVSEALRRSGVHSLLGVRLPPGHKLLGIMYVGLAETRTFAAREIRRLEYLGCS